MRSRPFAAFAASAALAVAATLLPLPSLAAESTDAEPSNRSAPPAGTSAQPSAPGATADRSKIAGTPGAVKHAPPPVSNASGLSDADLGAPRRRGSPRRPPRAAPRAEPGGRSAAGRSDRWRRGRPGSRRSPRRAGSGSGTRSQSRRSSARWSRQPEGDCGLRQSDDRSRLQMPRPWVAEYRTRAALSMAMPYTATNGRPDAAVRQW